MFLFLTLCIYHKRGMSSPVRKLTRRTSPFWLAVISLIIACGSTANAQDWFKTETSTGASNIRIAVADFKAVSADGQSGQLKRTFDATLYSDLASAGIFDIVSKSLAPQATPGAPNEINLPQWSSEPASAAMVAFGSLGVQSGRLVANGFLFDAKNTQYPQVLAKQYNEDPNEESARQVAHRFADEIVFRLGGGIPGIAETKIYYVQSGGGNKEIWEMDYDGSNQHAITHLGTVSLSPRIAPDNSRLAFSSLGREGFQIKMYSLLLGRALEKQEITRQMVCDVLADLDLSTLENEDSVRLDDAAGDPDGESRDDHHRRSEHRPQNEHLGVAPTPDLTLGVETP